MAARVPQHPEAFSRSGARGQRRPRVTDERHLAWLRTLPCTVTGIMAGIEAAHIRYPNMLFGKRSTGMGEKSSDRFAVPLSAEKHRLAKDAQHQTNEREFWHRHGIDPCAVAAALWMHSGDTQVAIALLSEHRRRAARGTA